MAQTLVWVVTLQLQVACLMADYVPAVKCPDPALWDRIGRYVCPGRKYFCLWDEVEQNYGEECSIKERLEQKGKRTVLNNENLNTKPCNTTNFQPFIFKASGNIGCVYQKSLCTEEGQLTVKFNSTIEDTRCRCDYNGGYAPVSQTKDPCYCVPALEDCTCYKKSCDTGEALLSNYTCISEHNTLQTEPCSEMIVEIRTGPTVPKANQNSDSAESGKDYTVAITVITMTVILLILSGLFCVYKRIMKMINHCKPLQVISEHREPIPLFEGEEVQLECETNKPFLSSVWLQNGLSVDSDDQRIFLSDGNKYSLKFKCIKVADAGTYSFYKKNNMVGKLEVHEVQIVRKLEEVYRYFVGEIIELTCTVNTDKFKVSWKKDEKQIDEKLKKSINFIKNGNEYTLKICGAIKGDSGSYKFLVSTPLSEKSCSTKVRVIDIQEAYYLRLLHLLETVAKSVVRDIFDREFVPSRLELTLKENQNTILKLKRQKHLNQKECNCLKSDNVKSSEFDIRIMVVLLKNLANYDIQQNLPEKSIVSDQADISRFMYVRNELLSNSLEYVSHELFEELWDILSQAISRQSEEKGEDCERLKNKKLTAEEYEKYLERDHIEETFESASVENLKDFYLEKGLKKDITKEAREIFDSLLKENLKTLIDGSRKMLYKLKDDKKLTSTELKLLLTPSETSPSSKEMDMKMLVIILKLASDYNYILELEKLQDTETLAAIVVIEYSNESISKKEFKEANEAYKCLSAKTYKNKDFLLKKNRLAEYVREKVARRTLFQEVTKSFVKILKTVYPNASSEVNRNSTLPESTSCIETRDKNDQNKMDHFLSKLEDFIIISGDAHSSKKLLQFMTDDVTEEEITENKEYNKILEIFTCSSNGDISCVIKGIEDLGGKFPK